MKLMAMCNFDDVSVRDYLSGTSFGENVAFHYDFALPLRHRQDILLALAEGRHVLHIGCCDHVPILKQKLANGTWLHGKLTDIAEKCVGIDIDASAVNQAREISGYKNIFYGDIAADDLIEQISGETFDYVILGEVLEHIGNPVSFLRCLMSRYRNNIKNVVITVPNAFTAGNIRNSFKTMERINSDHRFFFTPYTVAKVAWDAGLAPVSVQMAYYSTAGRLKRSLLKRFSMLAQDIVYIGTHRGNPIQVGN
jgi:SAM-dependent methyltransferase